MKNGIKCGPSYRCKNCCNYCTSTPGTQQNSPVELLEVEQEELLQDDAFGREYDEEWVREKDLYSYPSEADDEEDKDIGSDHS